MFSSRTCSFIFLIYVSFLIFPMMFLHICFKDIAKYFVLFIVIVIGKFPHQIFLLFISDT